MPKQLNNIVLNNLNDVKERIFQQQGIIHAGQVENLCNKLNINIGQLALELLPIAESLSIAPTSDFSVGAVGMGQRISHKGYTNMYLGANIEVSASSLTDSIHAEQCVTSLAIAHGETLSSLAISSTPCGYCRQFLTEFHKPAKLPIQIPDMLVSDLKELLPLAFGPVDLCITERVIKPHPTIISATKNKLYSAIEHCYAPYSGTRTACEIRLKNGNSYAGFSLESAAFNTSLDPLSVAMCIGRMSERDFDPHQIEHVKILEEVGKISLKTHIEALCEEINPAISVDYSTI